MAEHRLAALFNLAISTGMRQGELLGLRWREVDLEAERLSVVASMRWRNVQPVYTEPKSRRSRRQIALSPAMVGKLREHRHRQRLERVAAGPAWQGDVYDAVFTDEVGLPLTDWTVRHQFKLVLAGAGLPPLRFHDLRHTCATLLLAQRVNPKVVSEMLGHSTVAITLDLYSHVVPHMKRTRRERSATPSSGNTCLLLAGILRRYVVNRVVKQGNRQRCQGRQSGMYHG